MTDPRAPSEVMPLAERARVLLPGLYAWLLTVALPALGRGAPASARLTASLAGLSLVAGLALAGRRVALGRVLGIHGFLAFSLLTWALLGSDLSPVHLDRVRTALGMLGWLLFAFGWGRVRPEPEKIPEANLGTGAPLVARSRLNRMSAPIAAVAVLASVLFEALAFRVDRPEHAVFAHATAAACALLVLGTGSRVALAQGTRVDLPSGSTRMNAIAVRGALLTVLFGLGLVWAALK